MPYFIRVLGVHDVPVSVERLKAGVLAAGLDAQFEVDEGTSDQWSQVLVRLPAGEPLLVLERNPVALGELGGSEIEEFVEQIQDARPRSAARWLASYLPRVVVIYALQVLSSVSKEGGWSILSAVHETLRSVCGGILQADGEGFTNEEGYHILWQFSDQVSGPWSMAVMNDDGSWSMFEMELGNPTHREAFLSGRVPEGVKPA